MDVSDAPQLIKTSALLPNSLSAWQSYLSAHFEALATRRSANWPVFALEHGLDEAGVARLEEAVRASLLYEKPSASTYLPWIVYAVEFGYGYAGYEYWKSFAARTPGWEDSQSSRLYFRNSFEKFARMYRGAKPSGAWAAWFKTIAWPITHGIVPKDLQRHLVKLLFEERFNIPQLLSPTSVTELGKYLHAVSETYSDRFQQFAANEELIGLIATALLAQGSTDDALLSAATRDRIVADINRERAAAEWLSEAQNTTSQLRLRGLHRIGARTPALGQMALAAPTSAEVGPGPHPRPSAPVPNLRVVLRPSDSGSWDVRIEVPDLTSLIRAYPHLRDVLRGRGRLYGSTRPLASSVFLYGGSQPFVVNDWPLSNEAFIQYDATPGDLRAILEELFCPPSGSSFLFKLGKDGQATLLRSKLVQPGESYILLSRTAYDSPASYFSKVTTTCKGMSGLRFRVPTHLDDLWPELLGRLGLTISRALSVWPAGYPAAAWDGAGNAEWLLGEDIILGIDVDHSINSLLIGLDGRSSLEVPLGGKRDEPVFIALDEQRCGAHRLSVRAVPTSAHHEQLSGVLDFVVRSPGQNAPGRSRQEALLFVLDPPSLTLEDLWGDRFDLHINGPHDHPVKARICLLERGSNKPLIEKPLQLALPLDTAQWRHLFDRVRRDSAIQNHYDAAYACRVDFDCGALGRFSIKAERAFTPLRWIVRRDNGRLSVRLLDDTGTENAAVARFDCRWPDNKTSIPYETAIQGMPVDVPGGLYVAEEDDQRASIVVAPPPPRSLNNLQALGLVVVPRSVSPEPHDLYKHLMCAGRWEEAHIAGTALSSAYREQVLRELLRLLVTAICGEKWGRLEQAFQSAVDPASSLLAMRDHVARSGPQALRTGLLMDLDSAVQMDFHERVRIFCDHLRKAFPELQPTVALQGNSHISAADTSSQARRDRAGMLFEFALRIASSPSASMTWARSQVKAGLRLLLDHPQVLRVARVCVLTTHHSLEKGTTQITGLYAGWDWPRE